MDPDGNDLPVFESLSPSGRYAELTDYCVDRLARWVGELIDGDSAASEDRTTRELLDRLQRNQRALYNQYRFQLHKLFTDFKAIRPAHRPSSTSGGHRNVAFFDARLSRIQPALRAIEARLMPGLEGRLRMLDLRMKYLVHRSDEGLDDNPLSPLNLCNAFASAIGGLDLDRQQTLDLLELYGQQLERELPPFCRDCDLALSELGICFDLPFEENPSLPCAEEESEEESEEEPLASTGIADETTPVDETVVGGMPTEEGTAVETVPEPALLQTPSAIDEETAQSREEESLPAESAPRKQETAAEPDRTEVGQDPDAEQTLIRQPDESLIRPVETTSELQAPPEVSTQVRTFTPAAPSERISPAMRETLDALKHLSESPDTVIDSFHDCIERLMPLVDASRQDDLRKFTHYYSGLVNNPHVREPLRRQLLRLAAPLLYLVMSDPFFFRSSSHPVNDFLHSMIDFEIRYGHEPRNLKVLALLVDNLLQLDVPVLSDFQPITQGYEVFRKLEVERVKEEKKTRELSRERLRERLLEWTHELTGRLDIEQDALGFFYDDWLLYLLQVAHQYGEDANELQDARELARMLAWSLDPNRPDNPHYAAQRFTVLLREIDKALRSLDYPAQHRQRLRRILVRQFRRANQPAAIYAVKPVLPEKPAVQPFFGMLGQPRPAWAARPVNEQPDLYPDIAALIQIGDWIEIKPQPGSGWRNPQRGKLRWQSTDGIYRFFNQRGSIVLETDAENLNRMFARGEASLLKPFSSTGLGGSLGSGFRIYR